MPVGRIPVETHIFEGNETGFKEVYSVIQTIIQHFAFDFKISTVSKPIIFQLLDDAERPGVWRESIPCVPRY